MKITRTFMGENIEDILKQPDSSPTTPNGNSVTANSTIKDNTDFWSIDNVPYRTGLYRLDLAKSLLDHGSSKTQDEWVEHRKQAEQSNGFYTVDFPLYYALFSRLYELRQDPSMSAIAEQTKEHIKTSMFDKWLMTLTRLRYNPSGNDTIIHNYGLPNKYESQVNFVGEDGFITKVNPVPELETLLGSSNITEVNNVFKWLTGKDAYLWRLNSKPKKQEERVARFVADSDRAFLNCGRNAEYSGASLGVRIVALAPQKI